jgi:hypothetical protein
MTKAGYNPGAAEDPSTNPDLIEAAKSVETGVHETAGQRPEETSVHVGA